MLNVTVVLTRICSVTLDLIIERRRMMGNPGEFPSESLSSDPNK